MNNWRVELSRRAGINDPGYNLNVQDIVAGIASGSVELTARKETKIVGSPEKNFLFFAIFWSVGARSMHTRRRLSPLRTPKDAKNSDQRAVPILLVL